ncbi:MULTISPECIES: AzlD domain-containing protein [unclassified Ornithinimicrobium]|uniref:AzlD domain-containing protein n=1 Tax=unclassified Ornithinimicrobium TaxID=2615080 RepID=UPI0038548E1B
MTLWTAVLAAGALAYLIKLGGYLVPERILEVPWVERVVPLLTVALLSSLVVTQGFLTDGMPTVDARGAGIAVAVGLLLLRAPFLVVVALAALTAALVRLWS